MLHYNTFHGDCTIMEIYNLIDQKTGKFVKNGQKFLKNGDIGIIRIVSEKPMVVESFDNYPKLGRFALSDNNEIFAVGVIKYVENFAE